MAGGTERKYQEESFVNSHDSSGDLGQGTFKLTSGEPVSQVVCDSLIVNSIQPRINWEENLNERLSGPG